MMRRDREKYGPKRKGIGAEFYDDMVGPDPDSLKEGIAGKYDPEFSLKALKMVRRLEGKDPLEPNERWVLSGAKFYRSRSDNNEPGYWLLKDAKVKLVNPRSKKPWLEVRLVEDASARLVSLDEEMIIPKGSVLFVRKDSLVADN